MQHLKVLLVLLFVAAVSISLTEAWSIGSKKVGKPVGKRKQLLPFSYYGQKRKGNSCNTYNMCSTYLNYNCAVTVFGSKDFVIFLSGIVVCFHCSCRSYNSCSIDVQGVAVVSLRCLLAIIEAVEFIVAQVVSLL